MCVSCWTSDLRVSPFGGAHLLMGRCRTPNVGAEFRNPGWRSAGLRTRVISVRSPERMVAPSSVESLRSLSLLPAHFRQVRSATRFGKAEFPETSYLLCCAKAHQDPP